MSDGQTEACELNPPRLYGGPLEDLLLEQRLANMLNRIMQLELLELRILELEKQAARPH